MDKIFEWGRIAPEQLSQEASTLDTKIVGVFAVASLIVGVAATRLNNAALSWSLTPFILAFLCFLVILFRTLIAVRLHWFYVADNPHTLETYYQNIEIDQNKQEKYWKYIKEDFDKNLNAVLTKSNVLRTTIPLLAWEVILIVIWLFLASF